ncbi:PAS domain-containing protein [Nostoc sp. XA013]|nr:PAS domain-containing protein [Nostoc sp. XA013]
MRNSEQIQAEILQRIGFFPPFFASTIQNPLVLDNLWQQTLSAYINNPLTALFKEKLSAYLSRYSTVPYCMICHSCSLRSLGMKTVEVLHLLSQATPTQNDIEIHLDRLVQKSDSLVIDLESNLDLEESLIYCCGYVFLEREQSEYVRSQMRYLLGDEYYQHLIMLILYIKMCHGWVEAHPEIAIVADKRAIEHLEIMISESPSLAKFFDNYRHQVSQEIQSYTEEWAVLTERKRQETEQQKLVQALHYSTESLVLALNAANMGSWDWNLLTQEILWTPYHEAILGYEPGKPNRTYDEWSQRVHPEDLPQVKQCWQEAMSNRTDYKCSYRVIWTDGSLHWVSAFGRFHYNAKDQPVRMVGMLNDITELKIAEAEREQLLNSEQAARKEAEAANHTKDEFISILSHELRTPLNAMLGWSRLLLNNQQDQVTLIRGLETIERNAKMQSQLIEDLLDITRIAEGKIRLELSPIELAPVIEAAINALQLVADAKQIRLSSMIASCPGTVNADPNRLQQVIWNLLSNAIKFTPSGGEVEVRLACSHERAEIKIIDTGKGIEAEFLPYIFDGFRQAEETSNKTQTGLGLGLAIVYHLVELHGGTITAASLGAGQGSTFVLTLPLIAVPDLTVSADVLELESLKSGCDVNSDDSQALNGVTVLLVEDTEDTREFLITVLEMNGATVTAVTSVAEALQALAEHFKNPTAFSRANTQQLIVVSDIGMPDEDGYSLIRKIRADVLNVGGNNIPAIALTAYAAEEDRACALSAGFQAHLAKPVDPFTLIAEIVNLIGKTTLSS